MIVPAFEVERTERRGCRVACYGRLCVHEIEIRSAKNENFISLTVQIINDRTPDEPECVFTGPASQPITWQGVVKHIFKDERAILWMADFSSRLKAEWDEYLRIRRDRLGF